MPTSVDGYVPASAMVVVAHPDDAEFMAAGTVAKWARAGASVTYVVVTTGDKGSEDPAMTPVQDSEFEQMQMYTATPAAKFAVEKLRRRKPLPTATVS